MKATLEKVGSIKQCVTVESSPEEVLLAVKAQIAKFQREREIPGFRKGKAPEAMLRKRFEPYIFVEAAEEIVDATYGPAIKEVGATPIGKPTVDFVDMLKEGSPFVYKATFEVYPEVEIKGYEGLKLEREKISVTDAEVDGEVAVLIKKMTQLEPAEGGELGTGMIGLIDFTGKADGAPFEGSSAVDFVIDYGEAGLLGAFEERIAGMKAGEERTIEFDYDADYFNKELAGKKGSFHVKLKELRKKIVPELNDEFAKDCGECKTVAELKADIKKKILEAKEMGVRHHLRAQVAKQLHDKHNDIEVPLAMVDRELGGMLEDMLYRLEMQGQKLKDSDIDAKKFVEEHAVEATERARSSIIIDSIVKSENVTAGDDEVEKRIEELASYNHQPVAKMRQGLEAKGMLPEIAGRIKFEKALDIVISKAKIKEVEPKEKA